MKIDIDEIEITNDDDYLFAGRPYTGAVFGKYRDGKTMFEFLVVEGAPHGLSREWHSNGTLSAIWNYGKGLKSGEMVEFDEKGRRIRLTHLEYGFIVHSTVFDEKGTPTVDFIEEKQGLAGELFDVLEALYGPPS